MKLGRALSGRAVATRHRPHLPLRAQTGRSIAHARHQTGLSIAQHARC